MGPAGHYSDRFFDPDRAGEGDRLGTAELSSGAGAGEVLDVSAGYLQRPRRAYIVAAAAVGVGVAAAVGVAVVTNANPPQQPNPPAASRAGIETVAVAATSARATLWKVSGYTYDVDLVNRTPSVLELVDVTTSSVGTDLIWQKPLTLPAFGTAHLQVDFVVNNCAAVSAVSAPAELRLTLHQRGSTGPPGVAVVSVADAGSVVDGSRASLCEPRGSGQPPLAVVAS